MKNNIKKIIYIISFSLIVLILGILVLVKDSAKIVEIKDFIKTDLKVLCIQKDNNLDNAANLLSKYDIDYFKINVEELNTFEKQKIKRITDNKNINNAIIIYKNGTIYDMHIGKDEDLIIKFLKDNKIIPEEIVDNVESILEKTSNVLQKDYAIIYIPYKKNGIEEQDEIFKNIAKKYSIEYDNIDAYLLSESQKNKINTLLGISEVEDQILLLIKNNKIISSIRGIHSKKTYIAALHDSGFIDELKTNIQQIDYDDFQLELENSNKSIILLGINNCKDCDSIYDLLNKMSYNYNIPVKYINLENIDSQIYKDVYKKLIEVGYTEGFSFPLVIIIEKNQILDYIIGKSNEKYFIDVFLENGVIKGDVINE